MYIYILMWLNVRNGMIGHMCAEHKAPNDSRQNLQDLCICLVLNIVANDPALRNFFSILST